MRPIPVSLDRGATAWLVREGRRLLLRRNALPDSPVTGACLSLTSRCNEACILCLEDRDPRRHADLPIADARRLARLFAGFVPVVNSSTSEALLYPRFLDWARAIKELGSVAGVVTNGLALAKPGFVRACAEAGLGQVMISCHTADPAIFGLLTGRPRAYSTFVRALRLLDEHNARVGEKAAIRVIVEVVLTRPLSGHVEELLAFVAEHLRHSRPSLRVETYRPINAARLHPELQPDIDEVASLVRPFLRAAPSLAGLEFRHVPLCLLPGFEHLASEPGQILRREKSLGNTGCRSTELREQMRAQCALEQLRLVDVCWGCNLALVCPGVFDIPVPAGSSFPRAPALPLAGLAARLTPPLAPEALPQAIRDATADRLGAAGPRFAPESLPRLLSLLHALTDRGLQVQGDLGRVVVDLPDEDQPDGRAAVLVTPAGPGAPAFVTVEDMSVTYTGTLTPRVRRVVQWIAARLARGAP